MPNSHEIHPTRTIGVLLFDAFSNLCLANAIEPFRAVNTLSGKPMYRWHYLGINGETVHSSSGLPVQPEAPLSAFEGGDFLFVMPSYGHRALDTPQCRQQLRLAAKRFNTLVGLDTGSFLLASAGLLDGYRATCHWDWLAELEDGFPDTDVTSDRVVIDRDRASCGGATTALELVISLIEQHHGPMLGLDVSAFFMHGEHGPDHNPMLRLPPGNVVRAAAAIMRRHTEQTLPIAEIAARMRLSQRALEVHFARAAGRSPKAVYTSIRLREAHRMARQTNLSIAEISARIGYSDATAMARAFRKEFGLSPLQVRRAA